MSDEIKFENGTQATWTTIENGIIDDEKHFDGLEKLTFIVCLRHAFSIGGQAYPSQKTMAKKVGCTDRTIRNHLNSLEAKGFLKKIGFNADTQTVIWRTMIPDELRQEWLEKELERLKNKGKPQEQQQQPEKPKKAETPDPPYQEIIEYLNNRAGKSFKHTAKGNQKNIAGRWAEGYTVDNFKHIIDVKTEEWLGTDNDQYLNPVTLFRPLHFEKYLNQRMRKSKQPVFNKPQAKAERIVMTEEERKKLLEEAGIQ